jgi:hypothetical protein
MTNHQRHRAYLFLCKEVNAFEKEREKIVKRVGEVYPPRSLATYGGGLVRVVQVVDERNVEVEDATENGAGSVFTADAARKISEDGQCGREALTDVYIMLNEAANGGGE